MPIYSLEGTPGAGKTLYAVQKIIPDFLHVRDFRGDLVPRHIYTNISGLKPWLICAWTGIPYEAISEYFHVLGQAVDENGNTYEDKDLVRWWMFEPDSIVWQQTMNGARQAERVPDFEQAVQIPKNSLVIIDEIQNYYGSRDFATNYSKRCIDFITKNRHYGWTLWWMSQSVEQVDVTFRRNTQYVYFLESKENYFSKHAASVKKYEGWLAGDKINTPPFSKDTFKHDKRFYHAYSSYEEGVQGEKRYTTNVFLHNKGFMAVVIIFAVCLLLVIFTNPLKTLSGGAAFGNQGVAKTQTKKTQDPKTQPAARPTPASFSDGAGRAAEDITDSVCVQEYFVVKGEPWAMLSTGKRVKVKGGKRYASCD